MFYIICTRIILLSNLALLYVVTTVLFIYLRYYNYSLSDIVHLLTNISSRHVWVKQYIYKMQICLRILNPCHRTGQLCKLNVDFVKPIIM